MPRLRRYASTEVPPIGCDGEGHSFRLNSDGVATEVARALAAVKVIYLTTHRGIPRLDGAETREEVYRHLPVGEAELLLKQKGTALPADLRSKLDCAVKAIRGGVPRVHIIDGNVEEGLLAEVFSNEGIGTLVYANDYQQIRRARRSDVRAIEQLIKSSIEKDELAPRTRASIEKELADYSIFEVDGNAIGCVAPAPSDRCTMTLSDHLPWR